MISDFGKNPESAFRYMISSGGGYNENPHCFFYTMLISFIKDDHTIKKLNRIIAEEETHIQKLTKLRAQVPD